jgi:hypothetical protein
MSNPSKSNGLHGSAEPKPSSHSDDGHNQQEIVPSGTITAREQALASNLKLCWRAYQVSERRLAGDREKLGETLTKLQAELVKVGRDGKFAAYLREAGIPKRTAYNLIADYKRKDSKPKTKAKPKVCTTAQHSEERYQILTSQVRAHFLPLKKEVDFRKKLEIFFREIANDLLPGAIVEVREQ